MSQSPSALRAIEWLERQLADLSGIRNATSRDPIFKNWRQATLTALQRIWPGEQARLERFLRIPFSPADQRADARAQREWYSRGCQEAVRVLKGFIADVHAHGVPEVSDEVVMGTGGASGEFEVDFPTVDLPSGDLGAGAPSSGGTQNPFADFVDSAPQASDARIPAPPVRPVPDKAAPTRSVAPPPPPARQAPSAPEAPAPRPASPPASTPKPAKKGLNVRARLLDLLGLTQQQPQENEPSKPLRETPSSANLPSLDLPAAQSGSSARSPDIQPVGGAVTRGKPAPPSAPTAGAPTGGPPRLPSSARPQAGAERGPEPADAPRPSGSWPLPRSKAPDEDAAGQAPDDATIGATGDELGATATPAQREDPAHPEVGPAPAAPPEPTAAEATPEASDAPPHEPGGSVVMSRPTTLRGAIEKVTIESLLSEQFRGAPTAAGPAHAGPEPPEAGSDQDADAEDFEPGAPVEELLSAGSPAQEPTAPSAFEPADGQDEEESPPPASSKILPLPRRRPSRNQPDSPESSDSAVGRVDPEAFARATEDFMRSSPVLGATGRRVKRGREPEREAERGRSRERGRDRDDAVLQDADAIAIFSMVDDLDGMGVPAGRRNETRARLKDLASRIEKGELEWPVLKKAVWFAMDYPELARRLLPILLPWFDRAA